MSEEYAFGYPEKCDRCTSVDLQVKPYLKNSNGVRVMLIGQDPTIHKKNDRVKRVLMLDQPNSQLSRWLRNLFGEETFNSLIIYATNLIKCSFPEPPYTTAKGTIKKLKPYFEKCNEYLRSELVNFRPELVLTLGEPAHKLFVSFLDNADDLIDSMQGAFTGRFAKASKDGLEFDYSPCLHIRTFRVDDVYGDRVRRFKEGISAYFKTR